jgi:hypothetical protein
MPTPDAATSTAQLPIDSFPHIIDAIFLLADAETKRRFSQTCNYFRTKTWELGECACWLPATATLAMTSGTSAAMKRCAHVRGHLGLPERIDIRAFPPILHKRQIPVLRLFLAPTLFPCFDVTMGMHSAKTILIARAVALRWDIYDFAPAWNACDKLVVTVDALTDYMSAATFNRYIKPALRVPAPGSEHGRLKRFVVIYRPGDEHPPPPAEPAFSFKSLLQATRAAVLSPAAMMLPFMRSSPPPFTFVNSGHTSTPPPACACDFCGILLDTIQRYVGSDDRQAFLEQHAEFCSVAEYKRSLRAGEWEEEIGE